MIRIVRSTIIDAPTDRVWALPSLSQIECRKAIQQLPVHPARSIVFRHSIWRNV